MGLEPVTYNLIPWEGYLGDTSDLQNKAGFIAQDVLELLPGAVGYIESIDQYTLDYMYFIPYLTQTIQEQESKIQELEQQLIDQEERLSRLESLLEANVAPQGMPQQRNPKDTKTILTAQLYQNVPNPTKDNTIIKYVLPNDRVAKIVITNTHGQIVKTYPLSRMAGQGEIEVSKQTFTSGIYNYSLFIDNVLIDTKRMIFTE